MKAKFRKYFSVFLTVLILVSPQAYSFYKHTCLITQKSTVSFEIKDCSGKTIPLKSESKPQLKRPSCCEIEHITIKTEKQKIQDVSFDFGHATFLVPFKYPDFETKKYEFYSHLPLTTSKSLFYKTPIFILKNEFLI